MGELAPVRIQTAPEMAHLIKDHTLPEIATVSAVSAPEEARPKET